jgi:hypothetical protein
MLGPRFPFLTFLIRYRGVNEVEQMGQVDVIARINEFLTKLKQGFFFSFGEHYCSKMWREIFVDRLLVPLGFNPLGLVPLTGISRNI